MTDSIERKSALRFPIILIGIVIFIVVFLSFITKNEGSVDFTNTKQALSDLLIKAEQEFTLAGNTDNLPESSKDSSLWLEGSEDDPFLGNENADITIVEFSDFQCPFCRAAFPSIREFIEGQKGNVKYIYRDFPIEDIHPHARSAAEAASCAHEQGRFWQLHDRIFQNQDDLSQNALLQYAAQSGLTMPVFETCFTSRKYREEVEQDRITGVNLGVRGTPTWFVNGQKIEGVIPVDLWDEILKALEQYNET